jgi:hypothetical protein
LTQENIRVVGSTVSVRGELSQLFRLRRALCLLPHTEQRFLRLLQLQVLQLRQPLLRLLQTSRQTFLSDSFLYKKLQGRYAFGLPSFLYVNFVKLIFIPRGFEECRNKIFTRIALLGNKKLATNPGNGGCEFFYSRFSVKTIFSLPGRNLIQRPTS